MSLIPLFAPKPTRRSIDRSPMDATIGDWAGLPPDLVGAICKRLDDLFDFVCFRAVCKNWRRVTSISDLPPLVPWILEQQDDDPECLRFYSLISGKTWTIRCPKARGKYLSGPSHGYLYHYANTDLNQYRRRTSLLNPLTNDKITFKREDRFGSIVACVSPDPMGDGHIGFLNDCYPDIMYFYQPRIKHWSYVHLPNVGTNVRYACLKRMCYIHDSQTGNTILFDIVRDHGSFFTVPSPDNLHNLDILEDLFFVESGEKILRIIKRMNPGSY